MKDRVPRLANGCRMSTAEGQEDMLMIPEGALRLRGPGVAIVGLCDGRRTLGEIVDELARRFTDAEPARIEAEVISFLERLRDRGAIEGL
jgi:pyrroloquinoline quinone biosynthesis protein D